MYQSWIMAISARKSRHSLGLLSRFTGSQYHIDNPISKFFGKRERILLDSSSGVERRNGLVLSGISTNGSGVTCLGFSNEKSLLFMSHISLSQNAANFCSLAEHKTPNELLDTTIALSSIHTSRKMEEFQVADYHTNCFDVHEAKTISLKSVDFTKIHIDKLPTVILIGRPNVGKSALFNRLIQRREALVYNTPNDHVTRDLREGVAKLGDLRFRVLDSAGLEAEASSGSVLGRTAAMTGNVLERVQFALFLIDARDGLQPMDLDVGKWLRKQATGIKTLVVMNKAELLDDITGSLAAAAGEAYRLGFGDPIALSAETGLGMAALHEALRPLLEDYVFRAMHAACWPILPTQRGLS